MDNKIYIVKKTPWPGRLPVGTRIKRVENRRDRLDAERRPLPGLWFERVDGKKIFDLKSEPDAKFRLMPDEIEETMEVYNAN